MWSKVCGRTVLLPVKQCVLWRAAGQETATFSDPGQTCSHVLCIVVLGRTKTAKERIAHYSEAP